MPEPAADVTLTGRQNGSADARPSKPAQFSWDAVLSDEQVVEFISVKAAEIADDRLAKRDLRYRTMMGIILVGLGFLGLQRLDTAQDQKIELIRKEQEISNQSIRAEVETLQRGSALEGKNYELRLASIATERVQQALKDEDARVTGLDKRIDDLAAYIASSEQGIRDRGRLQSLRTTIQHWEQADGISDAEIDSGLAALREVLASEDETIKKALPDLCIDFLDQMLMLSSDKGHFAVGAVDELARPWIASQPAESGLMTQHYALRIVGTVMPEPSDVAHFERYSQALRALGFAHFALPHELVVAYHRDRADGGTRMTLLAQAALERPADDRSVIARLIDKTIEFDSEKLAGVKAYQQFAADHADLLAALRGTAEAEPTPR